MTAGDRGRKSLSATAGQAQSARGLDERLGIKPGHVVQELGYDTDCDEQLRDAIKDVEGVELVDEDYEDDVVDVVLEFLRRQGITTLDITGGAPELNPHFRRLVHEARKRKEVVIEKSIPQLR